MDRDLNRSLLNGLAEPEVALINLNFSHILVEDFDSLSSRTSQRGLVLFVFSRLKNSLVCLYVDKSWLIGVEVSRLLVHLVLIQIPLRNRGLNRFLPFVRRSNLLDR